MSWVEIKKDFFINAKNMKRVHVQRHGETYVLFISITGPPRIYEAPLKGLNEISNFSNYLKAIRKDLSHAD